MQSQTAWATGFLTRLLLEHLWKHYPAGIKPIDPRSFFSGIEGYETLKDPQSLLMDSHAWLPEETLREVHLAAERVSGCKDIAYQAALEFFTQSARGQGRKTLSMFEIIARLVNDVRMMVLCSGFWAGAYTTFLRLQPILQEARANEAIILSQCREGFHPLIGTHFMLKGNYEGFVRLYDFVEEASLEEEFLQHRVCEIVSEFEGYTVKEGREIKVTDGLGQTVAVFQPVRLESEEIPLESVPGDSTDAKERIVSPQETPDGRAVLHLLSPRIAGKTDRLLRGSVQAEKASGALRVVRGGVLRSGPLEYRFREGTLYEAPYTRYRFYWRERPHPARQESELGKQVQKLTPVLFDYLQDLKATQQRLLAYAVENKALTTENVYLQEKIHETWASERLLGLGPKMQEVIRLIQQIAPTDSTVLITGETGTGKELVARSLHAQSRRRSGRFVAINCGAIPEGLLESELFGHEKGAFTGALNRRIGRFELAHEGTLFLDEIGDVPPAMQIKLLRVLQERVFERVGGDRTIEVDVRIIVATHQDLQDLVQKGRFRKDLYYRLNVIPIQLPPLRDRPEDIPQLAEHFLQKYAARNRKRLRQFSPDALSALKAYAWPGNVRELENVIERIVTLAPSHPPRATLEMLPVELRPGPLGASPDLFDRWMDQIDWNCIVGLVATEGSMDTLLRKIEWGLARRAIQVYGSKSEAARALKRTYRWIRKLEKQMEVH